MADMKKTPEAKPEAKPEAAKHAPVDKRQQKEREDASSRGTDITPPVEGSPNEPTEPHFHLPEAQAAPEPPRHLGSKHATVEPKKQEEAKPALPGEPKKPTLVKDKDEEDDDDNRDEKSRDKKKGK